MGVMPPARGPGAPPRLISMTVLGVSSRGVNSGISSRAATSTA
jgi:hypothetical protein